MGVLPDVLHDARHASRVTSDTAARRLPPRPDAETMRAELERG
jgi:hypothetical protein